MTIYHHFLGTIKIPNLVRLYAGHNRWSKIHRDKAIEDRKRCQRTTSVSRELIAAIRASGPDQSTNLALSNILEKAKTLEVPKRVISNAFDRALGKKGDVAYLPALFECKGPCNLPILVSASTDNKNRTALEIRTAIEGYGQMAAPGSILYLFKRVGVLELQAHAVPTEHIDKRPLELNGSCENTPNLRDVLYELACSISECMDVEQFTSNLYPKNELIDGIRLFCLPENLAKCRNSVQEVLGPYSNSSKTSIHITKCELSWIPDDGLFRSMEEVAPLESDQEDILDLIHNIEGLDCVDGVYSIIRPPESS
jgi:transcriptional/translational regulatory protein YebC/TACO1